MSRPHVDCDDPTEQGLCLSHLIFKAHCQACERPWPCFILSEVESEGPDYMVVRQDRGPYLVQFESAAHLERFKNYQMRLL